jgi:Secretion system C-terminal sorting domain
MKNNLLKIMGLILSLILTNKAAAQTTCLVDSTYRYNAADQVISKNYHFYDNNGWKTQQLTKDSVNGIWKNTIRYNYAYTTAGLISENVQQLWVNNTWRNASKQELTYNTNDDVLTERNYYWDTLTSTWIGNSFQQNYTYNANNKRILQLQAYLSNGVPTDSTRTTSTYDVNDNEIVNSREGWSASNPVWRNVQKFINTYTSNNQLDSSFNLIWNITTLVYDTSYLSTFDYDAQGNQILYLTQQRNGSVWMNSGKSVNTYDVNNNFITGSYFYWDNMSNSWLETNQSQNTFNGSQVSYSLSLMYNSTVGTLINSYQTYYYYDVNDNLDYYLSESWNNTNASWQFDYKLRYFYDCTPLATEELSTLEMRCYPNPTSDFLTVELTTASPIEIVSITGSTMATYPTQLLHSVDVSSFPAGIYFVKSGSFIKKFIKK